MKGQSAMEFLAMVSMSALLLAALYGLAATKQVEISKFKQSEAVESVKEEVGFQLEMALVQGEGYSREFDVPAKISGNYYNVSAGNSKIVFRQEDTVERRPSLYQGGWINISTRKSNSYRIYNNGTVHVREIS